MVAWVGGQSVNQSSNSLYNYLFYSSSLSFSSRINPVFMLGEQQAGYVDFSSLAAAKFNYYVERVGIKVVLVQKYV